MKKTIIAQTLFGLLSTLVLAAGQVSQVVAANSVLPAQAPMAVGPLLAEGDPFTPDTQASLNQWLPELLKQINQLPEVQAQIARQQQEIGRAHV